VNNQDILTCAEQAGEWLLDRRERLEKHEEEPLTLTSRLAVGLAALTKPHDPDADRGEDEAAHEGQRLDGAARLHAEPGRA
jgi:hypothetical protein